MVEVRPLRYGTMPRRITPRLTSPDCTRHSRMNFTFRPRFRLIAGVILAAGLVGCQTCRDYVGRLPRPSLSKIDSVIPFRKPRTPADAEPYQPPKLEPVPDSPEPLILPDPAASTRPSRIESGRVKAPPALPPFEPETKVPSAGLFPAGPVRKMGFETSNVAAVPIIVQTGCWTPVVTGCCPQPCCPPPCCAPTCCEISCCSTTPRLSSILGRITHPFHAARFRMQNAKNRLKCRLSSLRSRFHFNSVACCSPCALSCVPCGNGCDLQTFSGGPYPVDGVCSPCPTGMPMTPHIPPHYPAALPQQSWQTGARQYGHPTEPYYQGQQAQIPHAARQPAPQKPLYQPMSPRLQVARSQQQYSELLRVEPASPESAPTETLAEAATESRLVPGHSPLPGQPAGSRVAQVFRATRLE